MNILVINGPNINMLGIREKHIYRNETYQNLITNIENYANEHQVTITCRQSNHEGEIVDYIQQAYHDKMDAIIINPAAYTHTSIAILDALKAVQPMRIVEVHLSDIRTREEFRKHSYTSMISEKMICGLGIEGYILALNYLLDHK